MKEPKPRPPESDVVTDTNAIRGVLIRGATLIAVPLLLVFAWITLVREPDVQSRSREAIAAALAEARSQVLIQYTSSLDDRLQTIAEQPEILDLSGTIDPQRWGLTTATTLTVVPMGDLGTVDLQPGAPGIRSHVSIDLARRAFNGDSPAAEFVPSSADPHFVLARPYGNPVGGVIIAEWSSLLLEPLLNRSYAGTFKLLQVGPDGTAATVAGSTTSASELAKRSSLPNSTWVVEFHPDETWLNGLLPSWIPLAAAAGLCFVGLLAGVLLVFRQVPKILSAEVSHIEEAADLRMTMKLRVPEMAPLAVRLRQLSLLSRRQLKPREKPAAHQESARPAKAMASALPVAELEDITQRTLPSEQATEVPVVATGIDALIRGSYFVGHASAQLGNEALDQLGRAVAMIAGEQGVQTLIVGHDACAESSRLRGVLVKALLAGGRDVVDLGEVPRALFLFACQRHDATGGIFVGVETNDTSQTGFQLFINELPASDQVMRGIANAAREGQQSQGAGRTAKLDIAPDYIDMIAMDLSLALPLKVVIDNNNGTAARIAPVVFEALDCDVVSINESSGQALTLHARAAQLGARVSAEKADFGVVFDQDADRLLLVDETGNVVSNDYLFMLLARDFLEREPGSDIIFDVRFSKAIAPFITREGGRALLSKSGADAVKQKMKSARAQLGADFEGYFMLAERWFGFEDAIYTAARLAEILASASDSLSELIAGLPKLHTSELLTVELPQRDGEKTMTRLIGGAQALGGHADKKAGLRIEYAQGWIHFSTNEFEDRLLIRAEGRDPESLTQILRRGKKAVSEFVPGVELQI